jgi:phosphate/sulfate permease
METFLPIVIVFIFVLAVLGIVAGVSNDATNFMSAAVGTKSASYRAVTIIASLGIIFGSLMSNGMMEIARNGVFSPQYFFANEIIYIYLAVMIANLILLDVFNTLGLPTSTSVSLVFELLGATVAIAMIKMHSGTLDVGLGELINTDKALTMIVGIFLSVAIAFIFGMIVQYITRLIFSFNFEKNLKWKIGIFSGIATTALIYFMLIKGMKDAFTDGLYERQDIIRMLEKIASRTKFEQHKKTALQTIDYLNGISHKGLSIKDFEIKNVMGETQNLQQFIQKPLVLNFVKLNDNDSKRELEVVNYMYENIKDNCEVLTVCCDRSLDAMYNFLKNTKIGNRYKWNFAFFDSDYDLLEYFQVKAFPLFILISPDGKVEENPMRNPSEGSLSRFLNKENK